MQETPTIREETPLCALAREHGTDKGGAHLKAGALCHAYTPIYHALLGDRRSKIKSVLEVGVLFGASLRMWVDYLPNAFVLGLDSEPRHSHYGRNYATEQVVVSPQHPTLVGFTGAHQEFFDLIVDDGSHDRSEQHAAVKWLAPCLDADGLMIVEDLQPSCHAEHSFDPHIDADVFDRAFVDAPVGLGNSHCWCATCGGRGPERLLLIWRRASNVWRRRVDALPGVSAAPL